MTPDNQIISEKNIVLERRLTNFFSSLNPGSLELQSIANALPLNRQSSRSHGLVFTLDIRPNIRPKETLGKTVRISTTSDIKWNLCAPVVREAGFRPVRKKPTMDEHDIHRFIRLWDEQFPKWYPAQVARRKQAYDFLRSPLISFDTVTIVDGMPKEKPKYIDDALEMLRSISGQRLSTEIGWALGMRFKSGFLEFLHTISINFITKKLSNADIAHIAKTTPRLLDVPLGLDMSFAEQRRKIINPAFDITIDAHNSFGRDNHLLLRPGDIESNLLDALFGGVPQQSIRTFLPLLKNIF